MRTVPKFPIFINGFHWGWKGASSNYWDGFDKQVMQHFKEESKPQYFDGALGGILSLSIARGNQITLNLQPQNFVFSNLNIETRYNAGYKEGAIAAYSIFLSLRRNEKGVIKEAIRIISHSMGGAFAKGFAQALMDFIFDHPNLTNGASITEYDFAPFQPESQRAVNGVETYQYSHHYDGIAHDEKIQGAHYNTSYDKNKGHTILDFIDIISQLPEGQYVIIDGQIVRR